MSDEDKFGAKYSVTEYWLRSVLNICIFLLVSVYLAPTPEYSMFPEGYGLIWITFGLVAVESVLLVRYVSGAIAVEGSSRGVLASAVSKMGLWNRLVVIGVSGVFAYSLYTGTFGESSVITVLLVIMVLDNLQRAFADVAVSDVAESESSSFALSAEQVSEMDDSDWGDSDD